MILLFVSCFSTAWSLALLWLCFMTRGPDNAVQREMHKRTKRVTTRLHFVSGMSIVLHSLAPDFDDYMPLIHTRVDQRILAYVWCIISVSTACVVLLLVDEEDTQIQPIFYHRRSAARGG